MKKRARDLRVTELYVLYAGIVVLVSGIVAIAIVPRLAVPIGVALVICVALEFATLDLIKRASSRASQPTVTHPAHGTGDKRVIEGIIVNRDIGAPGHGPWTAEP